MATNPRHLHAVEIEARIATLADFRLWRVQARNVMDHNRRECRWWNDLSFCVWLSNDGQLRGIASIGAVTPDEFQAALGRRWPATLRTIDQATVREEVI